MNERLRNQYNRGEMVLLEKLAECGCDGRRKLMGRPEKPSWEEILQAIEKRNA